MLVQRNQVPTRPELQLSEETLRLCTDYLDRIKDLPVFRDALDRDKHAGSNEWGISGAHTTSGHPIAVFGPQVAYFAPEILHEVDLHGPHLNARGASFIGTDIYVELGRGADYSWSATSAGSDIIDQRLERLCDPAGGAATSRPGRRRESRRAGSGSC